MGLGRGFSPAEADCGYRAPLAPRLARPPQASIRGASDAPVRSAEAWTSGPSPVPSTRAPDPSAPDRLRRHGLPAGRVRDAARRVRRPGLEAVRRRGRPGRDGPARGGRAPGRVAPRNTGGDARLRARTRRARADVPALRRVGRGERAPDHARVGRLRDLHPAAPRAVRARTAGRDHQRARRPGRTGSAPASERPSRLHRLRYLQDACRPTPSGRARPDRVRRRGPVRPVRRDLLRRRVRQGRARADLRAGRRVVPAVGHVRRRSRRARDDARNTRATRSRTLPRLEDAVSLDLPADLTSRPPTAADAKAIFGLAAACETADDGMSEVDEDDITTSFERHGFDPTLDSVLVFDGSQLVAWAETYRWRVDTAVLPSHRGRGIGSALLHWAEARGRARSDGEAIQVTSDANVRARELFLSNG